MPFQYRFGFAVRQKTTVQRQKALGRRGLFPGETIEAGRGGIFLSAPPDAVKQDQGYVRKSNTSDCRGRPSQGTTSPVSNLKPPRFLRDSRNRWLDGRIGTAAFRFSPVATRGSARL